MEGIVHILSKSLLYSLKMSHFCTLRSEGHGGNYATLGLIYLPY